MYSNEKKNGFSAIELIVRILFAALFIFVIIWLFDKKTPNMTTFYSSVFRENISYMQEAAESYFTDDKMPEEVGESIKMTLSEMLDEKILLEFVDKDGNKCDENDSYVSITKEEDESYILKTNLVCPKESDYVLKVLGCHDYCGNTCKKNKIISYQYKKQVTGTKTSYSCDGGYTLNGKYCIKTELKDSKSAVVKKLSTKTLESDAKLVISEKSSFKKVDTIKTANKEYSNLNEGTKKVEVDRIETTVPGTTTTKKVAYSCEKEKTEKKCTTTYETSTYSYSCNCTTHTVNFKDVVSCTTCTETLSTPVETCNNVTTKYNDTCYKNETTTTPDTITYSCPSGTTSSGSGSSLKCYKTEKTYSCPTGYTKEGSGSNAKCYKVSYTYSCPSEANVKEGSGSSLKCYVSTSNKYSYECEDKSYTLKGTKCYKTVDEESTSLSCDSDYKLEGSTCNKYETIKKSASSKKSTYKYYTYKWSTETSLNGWTKTGKTKVVEED